MEALFLEKPGLFHQKIRTFANCIWNEALGASVRLLLGKPCRTTVHEPMDLIWITYRH